MSSETEILPFRASELRGERILVVAPHPDDEIIGPGGTVALAADAGSEIEIIVVTDGAASVDSADAASIRAEETQAGLEIIGVSSAPAFLGFPDRGLSAAGDEPRTRIAERIRELRPDLIFVPSPIDIHPDHQALARLVWEVFQQDGELAHTVGTSRIAFYETSQPVRPTDLVDITPVAERKFEAIRAHRSQLEVRDYEWFARGLAQYRALTLDPGVRFAEAFHIATPATLSTSSWTEIVEQCRPLAPPRVVSEPMPVTVLVRTRNRPDLLREALDSIDACRLRSGDVHTLVFNDGGESPKEIVNGRDQTTLIDRPENAGRAAAMNLAAAEATTPFLCFLDDDDAYFPDHVETLRAHWDESRVAVYSDALSSFETKIDGEWQRRDSIRIFSHGWDPDLLVLDNYIPLPTLMLETRTWNELGGFDETFDLFEDWDFLLRLSKIGAARHVPEITCRIRIREGGDAITQTNRDGSPGFLEAKLAIWEKHSDLFDLEKVASWQTDLKNKLFRAESRLAETLGRAHHFETEARKLARELETTARRAGESHARASESAREMGGRIHALEGELARAGGNYERLARALGEIEAELRLRDRTLDERETLLQQQFAEIERLNGILDQIFHSRTWKAHQLIEKLKGHRG